MVILHEFKWVSHGGGAHPLLMRNVYIFLNKIYFMWFDSLIL